MPNSESKNEWIRFDLKGIEGNSKDAVYNAIHRKAKENHGGDYGKIVDGLSAEMKVPARELQAVARKLLEKDNILCIYSHENDNGCTAYLRLSNGAIAEIRLKETE